MASGFYDLAAITYVWGGVSPPPLCDLKIKIDDVDRTSSIAIGSCEIVNVLTRQIDTARLLARNAGGWGLAELQEVVISNDAETTRYFAGLIVRLNETSLPPIEELNYEVECSDYTYLLEYPEVLVNAEYTAQTDAAITGSFMATSSPSVEASTYVKELRTLDEVRFPRMTPREVIEILAELSGGDWYVDYGPGPGSQKAYLHYFDAETNAAPFALSDVPDSGSSYGYEYLDKDTWAPTANVVDVVGGDYLSSDQTLERPGDGESTRIIVPYKIRAPSTGGILVWRNDGSDASPSWTALTVGTGYLHNIADYDCLVFFAEKYLEFATAPPDLKLSVRISCRQEIPVRVRVRDYVSHAAYGRWLATVLVDNEIVSKATARQRGKKILAERSTAQPCYKTRTRQAGLMAGQRLRLINALRSLDDYFLIQRVTTTFEDNVQTIYTLELGPYNPDLTDLIIALKRQKRAAWSEEEELDELLEFPETFDLADSMSYEARGPNYYWAVHSPSAEEMKWNHATWG